MKQLKITAIALALTSIAASSAMAQSAKTNAWEGFYGEAAVGYGMITPSIPGGTASMPANSMYPTSGILSSAFTANTSASNVNNISTGLANFKVGYNFGVSSSYVVGIGVSYYPGASSSATGQLNLATAAAVPGVVPPSTSVTVPAGTALGSQTVSYNMKNLYGITVNPGYVIDKDRLAYFKVGYSGVTVGLSNPNIAYNTVNLTGYTLGLGYKQMITDAIYMLGEVNYASYGQKTASTSLSGVIPVSQPVKATGTDFLVGIGYRF